MHCAECRDLYRIYQNRNAQYLEARSAAFFQISAQIAVRTWSKAQRALTDFREHQAECPWAITAEYIAQNRRPPSA
jgi:hypothetical protein